VSGRGAAPRVLNSHRLLVLALSSIEPRVTAATARAPSGERLRGADALELPSCSTVRGLRAAHGRG
jgi:hypothetical protein